MKMVKTPKEVATLQDIGTLFGKHRTANVGRMTDLNRWFEQLKDDSVPFEDFQDNHLDQYWLVVPNVIDEVMSEKHIGELDRWVRDGGKMMIAANTGNYCSDHPEERFALLHKLGITPPEGDYALQDAGVTARVEKESPLFAVDDKIQFYSQADQKLDRESGKLQDIGTFQKWPYRWIPETDYFGYYRDNKTTNGDILARFPSGGVALSLHQVGKGQVFVFWGTPEVGSSTLKGMMARAAKWAGVNDPGAGSPIAHTLEGDSSDPKVGRHYALLYQEVPGTYQQRLPYVPDGKWLLDDMVTDEKLGTYTGRELREQGISLVYGEGYSPLKILRMLPLASTPPAPWFLKYRQPTP